MNLNEIDKLESNSHRSEEKRRLTPVVKSGSATTNKNFGKKMIGAFIQDDISNVANSVIFDLIIPGIKDTIIDIVDKSIQMLFFGKVKDTRRSSGGSYVAYDTFARPNKKMVRPDPVSNQSYESVYYETKADAESVLDALIDQCNTYGRATISDLFDASSITNTEFSNENYGWTDLSMVRVRNDRHGYYLDLPRPRQIN